MFEKVRNHLLVFFTKVFVVFKFEHFNARERTSYDGQFSVLTFIEKRFDCVRAAIASGKQK